MNSTNRNPFLTFCLFILFVALVGATAYRTYDGYSMPNFAGMNWVTRGMSDFHNGTYYPSMAFREGVNPYSSKIKETFPMTREAPVYMPFHFMVHAPLSYLDRVPADIVFFSLNVLMLMGLAWFSMRAAGSRFHWFGVLGISCLLVLSRPGAITLFTGYFTLEMVLGTIVALHFARTRPLLSGIGMLFAAGKPTFIIPLVLLMVCRRNFKAVFCGLSICAVIGAGGLIWLAQHEPEGTLKERLTKVVDGIKEGQQSLHEDETELPLNTWTRTDLLGMAAKFIKVEVDSNLDSENLDPDVLNPEGTVAEGAVAEGTETAGENKSTNQVASLEKKTIPFVPDDKMYLICMLAILVIPGMAVYFASRREEELVENSFSKDRYNPEGAASLSAAIILLTMLISIYHHSYDCLLVVIPWVAVTFYGGHRLGLGEIRRWIVSLLLAVPAGNYLSTLSARKLLGFDQADLNWQYITVINGACLTLALLVLLYTAFFMYSEADE